MSADPLRVAERHVAACRNAITAHAQRCGRCYSVLITGISIREPCATGTAALAEWQIAIDNVQRLRPTPARHHAGCP